jgi:hypothetical protein
MDWQLVLTIGCVATAAVYLGRRSWRTWTARGKGCSGCGCAAKVAASTPTAAKLISAEMLTARLRERR